MQISPAKENILKKIRQALVNPTPVPFPQSEGNSSVYTSPKQENEIEFAENFGRVQGRFLYCSHMDEMILQLGQLIARQGWTQVFCREAGLLALLEEPLKGLLISEDLPEADVSITGCEALIARTGSILMSSGQESGRLASVYAPVHICIAYTSQLVYDIRDGLEMLTGKYKSKIPSFITLATGPSRTADIEKTLVVGVHGPKEVYVFLIDAQ
ncbi:MAG TPA: lactate utilization protein B/C [Chitinophagaceae bacterium]|jgi:L-lactate dehydrogenase complex protein LldG|nr:lactate utilization protein B/C [Chitinophagaceae bacterium]